MLLCASMLILEWKERAFIGKVNSRCFCWFPAAILVHQNGAPIWRLHTKLYKGAWNVSANNSETVGHKDLRLGQIVYILVFYNISFSWLLPLVNKVYYCAVFIAWQWKRSFVTSAYIEVKMSLYCPLPIAHLVLKCHNFFWPYHKSFIDEEWGQDGRIFFWLISSKVLTSHLRWCYARRFATTIFSATQRCNIVSTLFRIVTT